MNHTELQITSLSAGQLEQLALELLPRMNYEWDNLVPSGRKEGTNQTRKGQPDLWKEDEAGNCIYVEVTRDSTKGKLVKDIQSCLNTYYSLKGKNSLMCIAFTATNPQHNEVTSCEQLCKENNASFKLIHIHAIAKELDKKNNQDIRYKCLQIPSEQSSDPQVIMKIKRVLYIPLKEELLKLKEEHQKSIFFPEFKLNFIKKIISEQHRFRVDSTLLETLTNLQKIVKKFHYSARSICTIIISNFFADGFTELYGSIEDGKMSRYDNEGEFVCYETAYVEEYNIVCNSPSSVVKNIIDYTEEEAEYDWQNDWQNHNPHLVNLFKSSFYKENLIYPTKRKAIIKTDLNPAEYIVSHKVFSTYFHESTEFKELSAIASEVTNIILESLKQVDDIFDAIYDKYERI
ncbi:hypothetical protein PaeCFBP13512_18370 [Paenibacillus sp. CFBP13512]|uniref:hypothetical protein n=1 Tax=Paenibacillus sp. CFBP13512 TaxID=2184007 RepID=UPI0010C07425|nr:hypothetical protein [Paenibacillus sp. CFBP13512]TKJ87188.1 hypothetical protein PaeCFBP13512_18370 [Paenibacillus sp. CFBP13512]